VPGPRAPLYGSARFVQFEFPHDKSSRSSHISGGGSAYETAGGQGEGSPWPPATTWDGGKGEKGERLLQGSITRPAASSDRVDKHTYTFYP